MTTTKEGGGRGEREREKERERERVKSRETLFCWSRQNWWEKREGRGGDGVNDVVNALRLPSLEERGSERQNETGLGCLKSRKSPRKMNVWISLVLVRAGWKEFVSKRRAKKNKEKRRKFLTQTKQTKKKNQQKRNDRNEKLTKQHFPFFYYATHTIIIIIIKQQQASPTWTTRWTSKNWPARRRRPPPWTARTTKASFETKPRRWTPRARIARIYERRR